jgi:hypothetical protein
MVVLGVKHLKKKWELQTRLGEDYFPLEGRCHNVIARDSRGGGRTEAISHDMENKEIATLPSVARNDQRGVAT